MMMVVVVVGYLKSYRVIDHDGKGAVGHWYRLVSYRGGVYMWKRADESDVLKHTSQYE